ncbi:hypothetical protein EYY60_08925 [Flavobacterium zhairuonense]|uniref:hypothetical protein n=1 Tax=Flavobacterium zhairuonense TaxID=2493631 RepID=UPI001046DB51|nr:hypothetical protein [Flavobacterium zhairuonense]KAF2511543.1 hypothetical protein EYY60_08925 [Flavobacterium zhairuonense]
MKKIYFLMLLFAVFNVHAQDEASVSVEKNQFKINVLFPGFIYEHGFSEKNTLYSEVALGLGYSYSDYYGESNTYIAPLITEQFRHYYNLQKRANKGKRTEYNSGNYLALNASYYFKPLTGNSEHFNYVPSTVVAALWGLQRTYKGRFNLEFSVGPGVQFDKYETQFFPAGNFTLGWVIGNKK